MEEVEDWKFGSAVNEAATCQVDIEKLNKELIECNMENDRFRAALHRIANKSSDPMAVFLANKALGRPV